ncbi:hypothetical protein SISNIDRAFT_491003 [Sistotremastrum niveocremeum HHB9708]|uniref:Uncharacterized protein n=1 Tax=Sistotremastrum niveocremeum HHB9708 TaxID=1314777 RepID=A0A164NBB6_9AGAM|nr:hypothetical protein SISNIDRAFT_491003 [Sistotremastrum niveocremeum HHB9708]
MSTEQFEKFIAQVHAKSPEAASKFSENHKQLSLLQSSNPWFTFPPQLRLWADGQTAYWTLFGKNDHVIIQGEGKADFHAWLVQPVADPNIWPGWVPGSKTYVLDAPEGGEGKGTLILKEKGTIVYETYFDVNFEGVSVGKWGAEWLGVGGFAGK